jgi:ribokinase
VGRIAVVGSLNVDHIARVVDLPEPGQTVAAARFGQSLGGKGFNQAVTAARQGADVVMIGCVGDDAEGDHLLSTLVEEGVDAGFVRRHGGLPTGRAHITVDQHGRNTIVVIPGANEGVTFPSACLEGVSVLLTQLEVPLPVVGAALAAARAADIVTVLNPAPGRRLSAEILGLVDYLIPNELEAQQMGEVLYHGIAIVTMGAQGALLLEPGQPDRRIPPVAVQAVDETGAGDAFCGCVVAGLADGRPLIDVLYRASAAGAHAVTVPGALPSLPTRDDVERLLLPN